ncbi:MAG: SUMF1/EgtB/PvdO family nonheme iron enzyme [Chloroflexi bacterium]|nr:SUMF1/EgtB/PvdO family nonheme iron enzyme [Chloroflexota bacterium]
MTNLLLLVRATLEAELALMAQAGFEDEADALRELLDRAWSGADALLVEGEALPLDDGAFLRAAAAGLLDPVRGFDPGAVSPAQARRLRRCFAAAEGALWSDPAWAELLERYQAQRGREDVSLALRERGWSVPPLDLADRLHAELSGSGAIAQGIGNTVLGERATFVKGSVYGDIVYHVVNHITQLAPPEPGPGGDALRRAYLGLLHRETRDLSLSGIDPKAATGEARARLHLGAVYTALLTLTPEAHERADLLKLAEEAVGRESRLQSALAQLERHRRLVLLGDPGSGKSTLVNFLCLCLAGEALGMADANLDTLTAPLPDDDGDDQKERQPWSHGPLLPVRVILRDLAVRGLPSPGKRAGVEHLWRFIAGELEANGLADYAPHLRQELMEIGGILLFDGLDEVPEAQQRRSQVKTLVESAAAAFPRCRVLVTSRTYAYQRQDWRLAGFAEAVLAPFSQGQILRFVDRWYAHVAALRHMEEQTAQGRAALLKRAIQGSEQLRDLARRPLLLTLMASLHAWRGGNLPEKREELYADTVDLLLHTWESARIRYDERGAPQVDQPSLAEWLKIDRDQARRLLERLAFEVHRQQPEVTGTADLAEEDLVSGLLHLSQNPDVRPARLVEFLSQRSGLLLPRGQGVYAFPHRTIQEYLAACYLTDHGYPEQVARLAREDPGRWREVCLLAGAKAGRGASFAVWALADALCFREPGWPGCDACDPWGALLAGQALAEGADLRQVGQANGHKLDRVQRWLVRILEHAELPPLERANAGNALATLGDPRFDPEHWYLPKDDWLGFVEIPAGPFLMGSDKRKDGQALNRESPQHTLNLPRFYMARYPVTVAQFRAFVEDSGYEPRDRDCLSGMANHPVVWVTWHEARAFAAWLTERLREGAPGPLAEMVRQGWAVRLPTEAEWEKAARGADGRIYPWGDQADPERANYGGTGIGGTSAVGCFPHGASPYGCLDLSGNVWEWTLSLGGKDLSNPDFRYPYEPGDGREDVEVPDSVSRVLRGGSYSLEARLVRCAFRSELYPSLWDRNYGFRLVVAPGSSL